MKHNNSRTYNAITNSMVGIAAAVVQVIINYLVRIILVKKLGDEIFGLHSLFQSITNTMALLEAGFSTAMIIHLYEPLRNQNQDRTRSIMAFYKRIYFLIGSAFILVSILVNTFVIDHIVTTNVEMWKVKVFFVIFALSFSANYFTYHKRSILFAEQKNRISIISTTGCEIVFRALAILTLYLWRNYYIFLILTILEYICGNLICSRYIDKHHPYLKSYKGVKTDQETKKSIFNKVKPLAVYNISSTVQQSSKSILISALLGNVAIVGYYGNYQLVISTAQFLFSQFGGAFTSAFGNLAVENDKSRMFRAYKKTAFVTDWIAIILCAGFVACVQDFIEFSFGPSFVLEMSNVLVLTIDMFVYLINIPIISIQNAMGLHNEDKVYMILQAVLAIVMGYIGGTYFRMIGILCGIMLPQIALTFVHKGIVIYRVSFGKSTYSYLSFLAVEIIKGVLVTGSIFFACTLIKTDSLVANFFLKGVLAMVLTILWFLLLSYRNEFFIQYKNIIVKKIKKWHCSKEVNR